MPLSRGVLPHVEGYLQCPVKIAVQPESEGETTAAETSDVSDAETICSSSRATSADEGISRLLTVRKSFRPPPGLEMGSIDLGKNHGIQQQFGAMQLRVEAGDRVVRSSRAARGIRCGLKSGTGPFGGTRLDTIPGSPSKMSTLPAKMGAVLNDNAVALSVPRPEVTECSTDSSTTVTLQPGSPKKAARLAELARARQDAMPLKVGLPAGHPRPKKGSLDMTMPIKKAPVFAECVPNSSAAMNQLESNDPIKKRETNFLFKEAPRVVASFLESSEWLAAETVQVRPPAAQSRVATQVPAPR